MPLATNIHRRSGSASYYCRLAVPLDLQPHFPRTPAGKPKQEIWQSLGTKDAREARARIGGVLAGWHDRFAEMRRSLAAVVPTDTDIAGATWERYQTELGHHDRERRAQPTVEQIEAAKTAVKEQIQSGEALHSGDPLALIHAAADAMVLSGQAALNRDFRAGRKAEIERHLASGETVLAHDAARDLIRMHNYAIDEGSPTWRDVCHRLLRADLEGLRRAEEHDRGDYTGRPRDPMVKAPHKVKAQPVAAPGEGIMDLFKAFEADNPKRIRLDTLRVNRQVVGMFADFVGATVPLGAVTKKTVSAWKAALRRYPTRAAEVGAFQGMSFRQILVSNEKAGRPTLSDKTVNRYLSALGGFSTWAMKNGHIENSPVTGLLIEKDRDAESKVLPYSADQLVQIFQSPIFTGCLADRKEHKVGDHIVRDHRYWLPILSLFTGARMNEIAQLDAADVRKVGGRWVIVITREGDARKTLKTKSAQRMIPLHPELDRLGFLAFHAKRAASNDPRLFPEIEPDARGQLSGNYSRFYGRYIQRIGVKLDSSINFHSFRHGFIDALRRAGFAKEQFKCLVGHSKGDVTDGYGALQDISLADRAAMIDGVSFPGLDLKHLHATA